MNDEEIEYITDLLFNENWKEQKDLILFTKDLKTANRRLAEQVNQLQSNWNSLRECIEENKKVATEYTKRIELSGLCQGDYLIPYYHAIKRIDLDNLYLDKMNELERNDKD